MRVWLLTWVGGVCLVVACSSENTTTGSSSGGGAGSSSGGASSGGASSGGASTGGSSSGGVAGSGGAASGGAAGTPSGGAAGSDAGGTGGSDAGVDASVEAGGAGGSVPCSGQTCSLATSFCCFNSTVSTCAVKGSSCSGKDIYCDGAEDCASPQICCASTSQIVSGDAAPQSAITCASSCVSTSFATKIQVCKTSGECETGSCKPAGSSYPTGYKTCQL